MNWDEAYDNRASVSDFMEYLDKWVLEAKSFRNKMSELGQCQLSVPYGAAERNEVDIFLPKHKPKGLVIYVHGGYWRSLDKNFWSHLAAGALNKDWAFAIPSYTLAPQARISEITKEIAQAIEFLAAKFDGQIRLIGHSAGGHLVARMLCSDVEIDANVAARISHTVAVSGVFDLEHLPKTKMNEDLQIDTQEIERESPARLKPRGGVSITCIVGGKELPEFKRQNELLKTWQSQGANVDFITSDGLHHFNVVEPLTAPGSVMLRSLLND